MTLNEFYRKFPVTSAGLADMLGMTKSMMTYRSRPEKLLTDQDLAFINAAIQELAYQLKHVTIVNPVIYMAQCNKCRREFTAKDEGARADAYTMHGLICDDCIAKLDTKQFFVYTDMFPKELTCP
jgi:hypothetical protein